MADMNTFVYIIIIVVVLAFVSIPLTDVMTTFTNTTNSMTTDTSIQATNNMYASIFGYTLLIIIIVVFIYLIKPSEDNRSVNYNV